MAWFRKTTPAAPLAVTMAGVKMGDRLLVIGGAEPALIAALAAKTGLTGEARIIESDDDRARRTAAAIERHGALADVVVSPWSMLPYESGHFDVAVAINVGATVPVEALPRCAAEMFRVLRPGGRVMLIVSRGRLSRGGDTDMIAMLQAAGFAAARVVAQREGMEFIEGIKRGS